MLRGPSLPILLTLAVVASATPMTYGTSNFLICTLSQEIEENNDIAVIATMTRAPAPQLRNTEKAEAVFRVDRVIKGGKHLPRRGPRFLPVRAVYFGDLPAGTPFLLVGAEPLEPRWSPAALPLTKRAVEYVTKLPTLPEKGADRLAYFEQYLEDRDPVLARDACDEFDQAPYADIKDLKPRMNRERLLTWIKDNNVSRSRKRVYLIMLSVCGKPEDAQMLVDMLIERSEMKDAPSFSIEPIIVAYLMLSGPTGMDFIDAEFVANEKASYIDTYSAIMALRFVGKHQTAIRRERMLKSLYHILDRPFYADLVIPDLVYWEDWSGLDRFVALFKKADENSWCKIPVMQYLIACPTPQAKRYLAELKRIDPESYKQATSIPPLAKKKPAVTKK